MGELFQRKPPAKLAVPVSKPATKQNPPDSDDALPDISKALGRVTVVHGAQELPCDVAGKPISYVREALASILQIPKDAEAWVNNQPVRDETTLLLHGQLVEFIKASGTKGAT